MWLQYELDIPIYLKQKIFLSYRVLTTYFRIFGFENLCIAQAKCKGLGSIRGVFGPMSKISFTLSNYSFVIWDKNYRRYFVI